MTYLFSDEPSTYWFMDDLDRLLIWAVNQGMSDISFVPNEPVWGKLHGQWLRVSKRAVTSDEIMQLVDCTSRTPSASGELKGGQDKDYAYEVSVDRFKSERFRVNASACIDGWSTGASFVMRSIPTIPPKIDDLGIEDEILENVFPLNGLILVTGVMGSGKSTLLASLIRQIRETQKRSVLTYESPIEFDLMSISDPMGPLVQTSIPEHLEVFSLAPRNAARRAADVILVGESRDPVTLKGMLEAAEIGVCAYSTVHTRSVAETPTRIINVFSAEEQNQIATTLASSLKLIIQQRLVPRVDGGRIALREFLVFRSEHRKELFRTKVRDLVPAIENMVSRDGQRLADDAYRKYDHGLISEETCLSVLYEQEHSEKESIQAA